MSWFKVRLLYKLCRNNYLIKKLQKSVYYNINYIDFTQYYDIKITQYSIFVSQSRSILNIFFLGQKSMSYRKKIDWITLLQIDTSIGVLCSNSHIAQSVEHGTYTATVASSSLVMTIILNSNSNYFCI